MNIIECSTFRSSAILASLLYLSATAASAMPTPDQMRGTQSSPSSISPGWIRGIDEPEGQLLDSASPLRAPNWRVIRCDIGRFKGEAEAAFEFISGTAWRLKLQRYRMSGPYDPTDKNNLNLSFAHTGKALWSSGDDLIMDGRWHDANMDWAINADRPDVKFEFIFDVRGGADPRCTAVLRPQG